MPPFRGPSHGYNRRMATSDHPFKLIRADPRMVEDTLRGFIAPDWARWLDFSTLAPLDNERTYLRDRTIGGNQSGNSSSTMVAYNFRAVSRQGERLSDW